MKRILMMIIVLLATFSLAGCVKEPVSVNVVLKNMTEYELEAVIFQIPQTSGTYSPMHDLITSEDEPLQPNEEREVTTSIWESDLGNEGFPIIMLKGDETKYGENSTVALEMGTNRFEISQKGDMEFAVRAIEE